MWITQSLGLIRGLRHEQDKRYDRRQPHQNHLLFSVPVLLGTLFQQIYNMADTIIVGQFLGEDALAAVGATGSTVYLVIGFASGLTQGCGILVSQAFGGHRLNELKKVVGTALLLTVVFSVILTIPTVSFSRQILLALHTPSNVLLYAHEYLRVIFGGILCTMAYNIAASILRSLGDSRTPLYFLILSSFLNIVLDIFLSRHYIWELQAPLGQRCCHREFLHCYAFGTCFTTTTIYVSVSAICTPILIGFYV